MSQTKYILSLDQGTTSSRAILFDNEQNIVCVQQREFEQIYPHQGWVEHNPMEIWSTQYGVMNEVVAQSGVDVHDIAAIGITNQRETTILWDKRNGKPIYHAIVWQCRRTAPYCDSLQEQGYTEKIREKTGLLIDAYFSATKIRWILQNVPEAKALAESGNLLFGTIDTWLIWNLTGGQVHATDYSNASRTMLFNIHTLQWDPALCAALDIPMEELLTMTVEQRLAPDGKPKDRSYLEKDLPASLQKALDEYIQGEKDHVSYMDCLWGELYGAINSNQWSNAITLEQADYLRAKYL